MGNEISSLNNRAEHSPVSSRVWGILPRNWASFTAKAATILSDASEGRSTVSNWKKPLLRAFWVG
ncbi:hypothetical protein [Candidatus Paracaedibacter symbiosus]|uniref:hypothetical protein n=1 Tax=Candidatus Paracaedibacter symbiosus TaxID=244582 RepID=UPI000509C5E0|nr:hypothetical protein [Candidatus Paracaedibacter symbiosus]